MPMDAFTLNVVRQPYQRAMGIIISGAIAEPICDPMPTQVNERPISLTGNHRETTIMQLGYVPDSPTPNKNRINSSDKSPFAKPVNAVNKDHHNTIRINRALGPIRSPQTPEGISKRA